jgi:hypothetical protein
LPADGSVVPSVELTDVQKGDNQEVECIETRFLDWKPTVAVASVSTFDLDPDLSNLTRGGLMPTKYSALAETTGNRRKSRLVTLLYRCPFNPNPKSFWP